MSQHNPVTVEEFIEYGMSACEDAGVFLGHGTDSMWDEVLVLVLHVLNLPITSDREILKNTLTQEQQAAFFALLKRRIEERVPACYLINESWFCGLSFYVDERVIIPRSPIAECIEHGFAPWIDPASVNNILDVCTGSGCMAIASAYAFEDAEVDAIDISEDALAVAKINVEKHGLDKRVTLIQSDLLKNVPNKQYDVIISNPPYVSDTEMSALPGEFLHEPDLALRADDEGLALAFSLMKQACDHLSDHGILIIEVGNSAQTMHDRHPDWPVTWLDFERGGDGVFLLTKPQLDYILSSMD